MQRAEAGELIEHERQDGDHRQQLGETERDIHCARRLGMQQIAVRDLVEQGRDGAQERHDGEQLEHQGSAPRAGPGRMIRACAGGIRADEQAGHDRRRARQHQELHRDAEARRLTGLQQQQGEEAGGVEHHAHHPRPDARIAFGRQDRERDSVGADGGSVF